MPSSAWYCVGRLGVKVMGLGAQGWGGGRAVERVSASRVGDLGVDIMEQEIRNLEFWGWDWDLVGLWGVGRQGHGTRDSGF